jgi:hypothetical protein
MSDLGSLLSESHALIDGSAGRFAAPKHGAAVA